MDIQSKQQDYQNQPEQKNYNQRNYTYGGSKQQHNIQDRFKDISSLDALTEYAISSLTEKAPSYFHECEKELTKEIRNFGVALIQDCKGGTLLKLSDEAIQEAVENRIGNALDASCILNHEYFKAGIWFGAWMVVQLFI